MNKPDKTFAIVGFCMVALLACNDPDPAQPISLNAPGGLGQSDAPNSTELETMVGKMAGIGWASGPAYSPDGNHIAYISGATGSPQVWISDLKTGKTTQATFFEDQVNSVQWSPTEDVLAISVAPGGGLNTQLYLAPSAGGKPAMITAGGKVNNWLGQWSQDGRYLSFSSNLGGESMDSYLYDTHSGKAKLIAKNEGIGSVAAMSPSANRAVIWRMRSRGDTDLYLLDIKQGKEQLLTPHEGAALNDVARFLDEDTILITTNIERELTALGKIDIAAGGNAGAIQIIATSNASELDDIEVVANARKVVLLWNTQGQSELAFLDVSNMNVSAGLTLPAEIVGGLTASNDGSEIAMTISGASSPQDVWRLEVESREFSQVSASAHDGIDLTALIRPTLISYQAHDGTALSGWLYLPSGADAPAPLVVSFHGGPEGQARPRFRATFQALLSRGISVFDANVRGSSGFGKTFVNMDNGVLRFNAIKDIKATVDHLVSIDVAKPGHVGIVGGSYGGYMVMAGLATYPDLFAAGANLFGVVNFETFFAQTEPWMAAISTVEYGNPVTELELLRSLSPIHQVDKVIAPTIVLHGANDTNVPVVEAEQVVESLKKRGIPVKYVLFPDEGHGWRKTANRVTSDVEIVRWFESRL